MEIKFNEHFNHSISDFPKLIIHDTSSQNELMQNYELEKGKEINYNNILQHAKDFLDGKLQESQGSYSEGSQESPDNQKSSTKTNDVNDNLDFDRQNERTELSNEVFKDYSLTVTRENFNKDILLVEKNVVLLIYRKNNIESNKALEIFETLTNNINEENSLVFAKIDITDNQILSKDLGNKVPSIKFYNEFNKNNITMFEKADFNIDELKTFVEDQMGRKLNDLDSETSVEDLIKEFNNFNADSDSVDNNEGGGNNKTEFTHENKQKGEL